MPSTRWVVAVLLAGALVFAGCGGGSDEATPGDGTRPSAVNPADCGLDAFANAQKPVEVTFWHTMQRATYTWLVKTTNEFNRSQSDVRVRLVQFPGYQDLLTKYLAGLSTRDLPDLFQPEDTTVVRMIDSRSVVPVQACVAADGYDVSKLLPRARAYYTFQDVLWGMPWAISNPILWYNKVVFERAGLDPERPPRTLAEVEEYSRKIVASGAAKYGIALRVEPYVFEFLNAKSGGTLVNNDNGRSARTTAATLDTPVALDIWSWWNDMVRAGLALNTGGAANNFDHMLALANEDKKGAAMAIEASGVLGTVKEALETGEYEDVAIGTGALPSISGGGGVPVGDASLWIAKASAPEKRAAAWQFVKYLASAELQAAIAVAAGYAPMREDATAVPALVARWKAEPYYRVSYDQLTTGEESPPTAGSLIGDYQGVRDAVKDGMLAMLTGGLTPKAALERAQGKADASIKAYNERLGVG